MIRSFRSAIFAVMGAAAFGFFGAVETVHAQDFETVSKRIEATCSSLGRKQVDCGCVGRRIATYLHVSPSDEYSAYYQSLYRDSIGVEALDESLAEAAMASDEKLMNLIAAYEPHGGEGIEFEEGCVIEGAAATPIPEIPQREDVVKVFNSCAASTGEPLYCQCTVGAQAALMSEAEFSVFAQRYGSVAGAGASRSEQRLKGAAAAGVSPEIYDQLVSSAERKMNAQAAGDGGYLYDNRCHALLYGVDGRTGELQPNVGASERQRAGRPVGLETIDVTRPAATPMTGDEMMADIREDQQRAIDDALEMSEGVDDEVAAILGSEDLAQIRSADGLPSAAAVVAKGCKGEAGRSPAYCGCLATKFSETVPASMSEGGKRMAAMMLVGSGLPPVEAAQIANTASQMAQMEAAQALGALSTIPEQCEAEALVASVDDSMASASSVRERYKAVCELQFDGMGGGMCDCATDYFDENLNDNEWSMLIDIQVAELKGEDDAFAKYAENIGMTRQEAEQAMMSNPRVMQAMMGFTSACLGGGFGPQ